MQMIKTNTYMQNMQNIDCILSRWQNMEMKNIEHKMTKTLSKMQNIRYKISERRRIKK